MHFRHEWKHVLVPGDLPALQSRLSAVMQLDPHAIDGSYSIRSLYFDNLYDKALKEKINGLDHREKFRIRTYNGDSSLILLEKKSKHNGLCCKEQQPLTIEETLCLLKKNTLPLQDTAKPLLKELICKMTYQGLQPQTIVDYRRRPFLYEAGNVRITLDYDLRTALRCTDFLNPDCITIPVPDVPAILEVKWDSYLPTIIRDLIQTPTTRSTAFSKYAACRIYG